MSKIYRFLSRKNTPQVPPPKGRITDAWASYMERVMTENPAEYQVQECRRAFYAGAEAAMSASMKIAGLPEDKAENALVEMEGELLHFVEQVKAGEA